MERSKLENKIYNAFGRFSKLSYSLDKLRKIAEIIDSPN